MQKQKKMVLALVLLLLSLTVIFAAFLVEKPSANSSTGEVAQGADLVWESTYGGTGDDRAFFAADTGNGHLVVGSSSSFDKENRTEAWVLRMDIDGNQVWNETFLENSGTEFRSIIRLDDGFLLVGNTFLPSGCSDGYVVRISDDGTQLWNRTVKQLSGFNKLFSACKTDDAVFLVGLAKPAGNCNSSVWVAKIGLNGDPAVSRRFEFGFDDAGRAVTVTQDGCLMVAGYTDSAGDGNYDFLVMKLSFELELLWFKTFGGAESDKAYAMLSASNGCVVAGDTRSKGAGDSDAWIIKVDLDGNLVWERTVGGNGFDTPTCISPSSDGGFVLAGTTFSFGNGNRDFWLFKLCSAGEVAWSCTAGRNGYEEAYGVVECSEYEFFLAGWTNSIGEGRYDFYGVKVAVRP